MIKVGKKVWYGILYVLLISAAVFLCLFSSPLQSCTERILVICARSVAPSLFPFMVISSLLTQNAPLIFSDSKRTLPVCHLPICSLIAVILGALCGFPTGVVTVAGLKKRGLLSKGEAEKLSMISNNTGPAFVIEVIGSAFWGSRLVGIKLYFIQLLSCFILGMIYFLWVSKKDTPREEPYSARAEDDVPSFLTSFSEAVSSSALGIIKICGFVVFFSVAVDCISIIFPEADVRVLAFVSSFLEFTSGCRRGAELNSVLGISLSAFAIGFSGLSVIAQSSSFSDKAGFSLRKTVIFKFFQGILCAVLAYFLI